MSVFDYLPHLGYSGDLHQQLKGLAPDCSGYQGAAVYQLTAIVTLALSFLAMLNYYYGLCNNPRFTHRRVWLLHLLTAGLLCGLFAYYRAVSYLPEERHCADIHFSGIDCLMFGLTTMAYSLVAGVLFSLLLKWKSVSNKKIPF